MSFAGSEIRDLAGFVVVWGVDLDRFDCEGFRGILREHSDDDVVYYLGFRSVGGCYVNEDVAGFEADFGVVGVDYWRHGADCSICIKNDWVDWRVSDYVKVAREVFVVLLMTVRSHGLLRLVHAVRTS